MVIIMFYSYLLALLFLTTSTSSQEDCDSITCAKVADYVCGAIEYRNGSVVIMKYQNICIMKQMSCKLKPDAEIYQASDILCNINMEYNKSGRRETDFSIVGTHQACNHSCPIYCMDTYDPACAEIYTSPDKSRYIRKTMINHCHIDLFSCSSGLYVTILPLSKCLKNDRVFQFLTQVAAMKTLKLLDESRN